MKKLLYSILAAATVAFSASSCTNDFLEEEMVATITQQYYETEAGLDALVVGMYDYMRYFFHTHDNASGMWESLNDTGADTNQYLATAFSPVTGGSSAQGIMENDAGNYPGRWGVYPMYNDALTILEILEEKGESLGGNYADEAYRNKQKATAMFAKDYAMRYLACLQGDPYVPQKRTVSDNGIYYAPRSTSESVWQMFIDDMEFAYEWLPDASAYTGTLRNEYLTKGAAAFFLAHLYFERAMGNKYASLRNADGTFKKDAASAFGMLYKGGDYEDDLASAIYWATKVIDDPNYDLEDDFNVHCENISGNYTDEESREIVWAMAADPAFEGEKNANGQMGWRMTFYYGRYTGAQWGLQSDVWTYGTHKGKTGLGTWGYDVFTDKINDARYDKTFYTTLYPMTPSSARGVDNVYADDTNAADNGGMTWQKNLNPFEGEDATKTNKYVDWFNANKATFFGPNAPYDERLTAVVSGGTPAPDYTTTTDKMIKGGEPSLVMIANDREHAIDADLCHSMPFVVSAFWCYYESDVNNNSQIDIVDTRDSAKDSERRYYHGQVSKSVMSGNSTYGPGQGATTSGLPFIKKYIDPDRATVRGETSSRNITVFRLADMYLLRAWANGLSGNMTDAIDDINVLRARAAFKVGETRSLAVAQFADYYNHGEDLTATEKQWPYTVEADTYDRIKVSADYWTPGTPEFEGEKYPQYLSADITGRDGGSVAKDPMNGYFDNAEDFYFSNFMINEYCREMLGEPVMLFIQHNVGLRYARLMRHRQRGSYIDSYGAGSENLWPKPAYNYVGSDQRANGYSQGYLKPHYMWQPVTVSYLDKLTDENGNPLTQEMRDAYQNPGYEE